MCKSTQSGIKIFKSDLKTGIIFSFLFYTRNFAMGLSDPVENLSCDYLVFPGSLYIGGKD